jgi:hypothetical protein
VAYVADGKQKSKMRALYSPSVEKRPQQITLKYGRLTHQLKKKKRPEAFMATRVIPLLKQ